MVDGVGSAVVMSKGIGVPFRSVGRSGDHGWAFFFFQAEDGIRDLTVTGVQTCALPIYPLILQCLLAGDSRIKARVIENARHHRLVGLDDLLVGGLVDVVGRVLVVPERSEERRVGKECRSRWSPYH